jgi:alkylation response protein AidB-like acyl-CoA dehydrogenase
MTAATRIAIDASTEVAAAVGACRDWIAEHVPAEWAAAARRGPDELRRARSRADYERWYPTFGASGLVVPTWEVEHGGLGVGKEVARAIDSELAPTPHPPHKPHGQKKPAPAQFAHRTEEQRRRFLPPMVRNEERWCQLFSEPGAGSDLASLACRAVLDGDQWIVSGQKVWTTWANVSDFAILLVRTNVAVPKRNGITYLLLDLHQPGVTIRPLRQITGDAEFNEVFLDGATVPDAHRVGAVDDGWKVSASTLSSERQMVSGSGSGASIGRLGGISSEAAIELARSNGRWRDPVLRQELVSLWSEEQIRGWTNLRVRAHLKAGQTPGPAASVGKVHQAHLNQRIQSTVVDLLGAGAIAWDAPGSGATGPDAYGGALRSEVSGFLRSRANSIEGGTTEVNKTILGERVLGLPREPDPWQTSAWSEVPRSCATPTATSSSRSNGEAGWAGSSSTGPRPATRPTPGCWTSSSGRGRSSTTTPTCGSS